MYAMAYVNSLGVTIGDWIAGWKYYNWRCYKLLSTIEIPQFTTFEFVRYIIFYKKW